MTENKVHHAPTGEFEVGDVVNVCEPLEGRLEGSIGDVLTSAKKVDHGSQNTLSAHVVRIRGTDELTILLGPEMALSPENNRRQVGRKVSIALDGGETVDGTYASEPRRVGSTVYQVVEVNETGDFEIEIR